MTDGVEETPRLMTPDEVATSARAAAQRLAPLIRKTPLRTHAAPGDSGAAETILKLENLQETGSFKFRGALNRLLTLPEDVRQRGCVTASSGNHGAALASAMRQLEVDGVIFVPEQTSDAKLRLIRDSGGRIEQFGTDGLDTELHAREYARANDLFYVSPYNDPEVIAGQGTIGIELLEDLDRIDRVFVAVGGGGLISGIASVLKDCNPDTEIVGCQPSASAIMKASVEAGEILDLPSASTLSDGTAGGIEPGAITFPLGQQLIDRFVAVEEAQIAAAMRGFYRSTGYRVEGAAGVALAAAETCPGWPNGRSVVIVCGANVSEKTWSEVMQTERDGAPS